MTESECSLFSPESKKNHKEIIHHQKSGSKKPQEFNRETMQRLRNPPNANIKLRASLHAQTSGRLESGPERRRHFLAPSWKSSGSLSYRELCQELSWLQELRSLASCSCSILSSSPSE